MEVFGNLHNESENDSYFLKENDLENSNNEQYLLTQNLKRKINEDNTDDTTNTDEIIQNNQQEKIIIEKKTSNKRRKKQQECIPFFMLSEIFLRIVYPLSVCNNKNVTVGFCKFLDYSPGVLLNHGGKQITFFEDSWNSFNKSIHLIHCYLINKVYGKKTNITVESSDIEVGNIKVRGDLFVRIRNLSSHDNKVLLNRDELEILINSIPAIERYMHQLESSKTTIKDYLVSTIEDGQDTPLIYSPLDNSIYNRLPQEVYLFRNLICTLPQNTINDLSVMEDELVKIKSEEMIMK